MWGYKQVFVKLKHRKYKMTKTDKIYSIGYVQSKWKKWKRYTQYTAPYIQLNNVIMLCEIFSRNGLPVILISCNASLFTSTEFKEFCTRNLIQQWFIAPGHPGNKLTSLTKCSKFKTKILSYQHYTVTLTSAKIQESCWSAHTPSLPLRWTPI